MLINSKKSIKKLVSLRLAYVFLFPLKTIQIVYMLHLNKLTRIIGKFQQKHNISTFKHVLISF